MKVAFYTLGCKVNQCDTAELAREFRARGHEIVSFDTPADVYVINTCTVTHQSDVKSRKAVHQARRRSPGAVVVVTGCGAAVAPRAFPGASVVAETRDSAEIVRLAEEAAGVRGTGCLASGAAVGLTREAAVGSEQERRAMRRGDAASESGFDPGIWRWVLGRNRAFLKVQEGCEQFCTYCIVPYARGPSRSIPPDRCLERATQFAKAGFKEIVLTGTHLGAYGKDLDPPVSLEELLRSLHGKVAGAARLRLSSLEPLEVTGELIDAVASLSWVCHHFHIPVQSGSDRILSAMGRPYSVRDYLAIIGEIRGRLPDAAITTDVMVGFPGETDADFEDTVKLVRAAGFSRLHVFRYSPRPNTPAYAMKGRVRPEVARERSSLLVQLGAELASRFHLRHVGRVHEVLVEDEVEAGTGRLQGLTRTYVRARSGYEEGLQNQLVEFLATEADAEGIVGRVVGKVGV